MASLNDQLYKADGGKLRLSLLLDGMPKAIKAVAAVLTYGAQKYEAHSWKGVDMSRYEDAKERHNIDRRNGELFDAESGLLHLAHEACNSLFLLQDYLDKHPEIDVTKFNLPPTSHKASFIDVPHTEFPNSDA